MVGGSERPAWPASQELIAARALGKSPRKSSWAGWAWCRSRTALRKGDETAEPAWNVVVRPRPIEEVWRRRYDLRSGAYEIHPKSLPG